MKQDRNVTLLLLLLSKLYVKVSRVDPHLHEMQVCLYATGAVMTSGTLPGVAGGACDLTLQLSERRCHYIQ